MADEPKFEKVELVGRRVPDFQKNEDADGRTVQTELPGEYEVGIMFGKKFHAISRFQAGNVLRADGTHVEPEDEHPVDQGESQA